MPEFETFTLPGRIVFLKEHPFGGFDVHLFRNLPRIGYVRQMKAGDPEAWSANAGQRKKGGLSKRDAIACVVDWYGL